MDTRNEWRNQLIAEHTEVARRIALKMARRCPDWIAREDLVAAGLLGLTEAAERFAVWPVPPIANTMPSGRTISGPCSAEPGSVIGTIVLPALVHFLVAGSEGTRRRGD